MPDLIDAHLTRETASRAPDAQVAGQVFRQLVEAENQEDVIVRALTSKADSLIAAKAVIDKDQRKGTASADPGDESATPALSAAQATALLARIDAHLTGAAAGVKLDADGNPQPLLGFDGLVTAATDERARV